MNYRTKSTIRLFALSVLLIGMISAVLLVMLGIPSAEYSKGTRIGVITKFSYKGYLYKTYEGELLMGGLVQTQNAEGVSGVSANVFQFSLDAEMQHGENLQALADTINKALETGQRIKLEYQQENLTDLNRSRGSTQYYVIKASIIY